VRESIVILKKVRQGSG